MEAKNKCKRIANHSEEIKRDYTGCFHLSKSQEGQNCVICQNQTNDNYQIVNIELSTTSLNYRGLKRLLVIRIARMVQQIERVK